MKFLSFILYAILSKMIEFSSRVKLVTDFYFENLIE